MNLEYFQLITRIETVDRATGTVETLARVPLESTVFEGHFPGHPLMPGVLLIEAMAQSSGYAILAINGFSRMPFLSAVREAKLIGPGPFC